MSILKMSSSLGFEREKLNFELKITIFEPNNEGGHLPLLS